MEVRIIPHPQALPGQCYYCGSATREWYLDTGIQMEFYGAVIFCNECMNNMMEISGYASRDTVSKLCEENREIKALKELYENKAIALEQAINALKVAGYGTNNLDIDGPSLSDYGSVLSSDSSPSKDIPDGERQLEFGEEGPSEQDSDEGVADLSSSDSEPNPFSIV